MIQELFSFLLLVSIICLVVGLKKPQLFSRIFKRDMSKKSIGYIFGITSVAMFLLIGATAPSVPNNNPTPPTTKSETTSNTTAKPTNEAVATPSKAEQQKPVDKQVAEKELTEIINLSKQAGLITSYEFSNKASVVYADSGWYTQTVSFKKDLMAKIGTLKKQITGYYHFEVRDAYSNEKVAEITAFSGSIEVYK